MQLIWQDLHHSQLSATQLYAILALRCDVFVVEQHCPYQDVDGLDLVGGNRHVIAWQDDKPLAYLRILENGRILENSHTLELGAVVSEVAIGRVIIAPEARGLKLGYALMEKALQACAAHWPQADIVLSAQAHLQTFYASFGFVTTSDVYDEDGIPHIDMRRV